MADILRVTTPLVNKYQAVDPKRGVEIPQFNLQDLSRVAKPLADNELLQQHNGLTQERETSALLLDMLKDPSITVGFLKNISLLQEVIRLMPLGSRTLTGEIQQLFDQLLLLPDDLFTEMLFQEEASTWFRGEVFDLLRAALEESPGDVPLRQAAVDFLKSLNSCWTQQDSLDSVANNLQYLSDALSASRGLSQRLLDLSRQLRRPGAGERFDELKHGVMEVLREVEDSILFSPKMEKVVSIAVYNLSRFGGGTQRLQQSLEGLLDRLPPRVRVRRGAPLELPHILVLLDDRHTVRVLRDEAWTVERFAGYLSLFAMAGDCRVTLTGMEYPLEDHLLTGAYPLGVSNRVREARGTVTVRDGALLAVEYREFEDEREER